MDIDSLSSDQVRNVLREAIEGGAISEKLVNGLIVASPSTDMKLLVDSIHLLLCKENHDTKCEYYQEEQTPNNKVFLQYAHHLWVGKTMDLMKLTDTKTVGEMTKLVRKVSHTMSELGSDGRILIHEIIVQTSPSDTQPKTDQKIDS